jgi:hypothetical protein
MQFRAEMYNVFNSPQFSNPDSNPNDGTFGEINSTREFSEREIQFALKLMF